MMLFSLFSFFFILVLLCHKLICVMWLVYTCKQYLNCRMDEGDASLHRNWASHHRDWASPHRDLSVPPSRFEHWLMRGKRRTKFDRIQHHIPREHWCRRKYTFCFWPSCFWSRPNFQRKTTSVSGEDLFLRFWDLQFFLRSPVFGRKKT